MTYRVLRMAWRQHKQGNNKPLMFMWNITVFGLTHWWCRCGRWKGPTLRKLCKPCANEALIRNILEATNPEAVATEEL
jgi:hypothetical protein